MEIEDKEILEKVAVETRELIFDDADDIVQSAMVASPIEVVGFACEWIKNAKLEIDKLKGDHQSDVWEISGLEDKIEELRAEILGRGLQIGQLLQNQAKLIEALKPFAAINELLTSKFRYNQKRESRTIRKDNKKA